MGNFVSRRLVVAASTFGLCLITSDRPSLALADDKALLIAIPAFAVSNPGDADIAVRIRRAIIDRLSRLKSYALSDATASVASSDVDRPPSFATLESRNVQFLIVARVDGLNDGRLRVVARIWNVPDRQHFYAWQVTARIEEWQQTADVVADEIGRRLADRS